MKTINVTKPMEVEECKRCDGYIDNDMYETTIHFVSLSDTTYSEIPLNADHICGKCKAIIMNATTKRTRKPKTPKGGA